jgi:hypothetical protein
MCQEELNDPLLRTSKKDQAGWVKKAGPMARGVFDLILRTLDYVSPPTMRRNWRRLNDTLQLGHSEPPLGTPSEPPGLTPEVHPRHSLALLPAQMFRLA